jgi:enediyne biosynthesis protein E4
VVVVYNGRWARHLSCLNERKSDNHRILLRLVGKKSNHSAIGARVNITAGKHAQIYEAREGGAHLSSNDQQLHFGLGGEAIGKNLKIEWPSGLIEDLVNVPADDLYTIVEGNVIQPKVKLNLPNALSLIDRNRGSSRPQGVSGIVPSFAAP